MAEQTGADGAEAVPSLDKAVSKQRGPLPNPDARNRNSTGRRPSSPAPKKTSDDEPGRISGARRGRPPVQADRVRTEEPTPAEEMDNVALRNKAGKTAESQTPGTTAADDPATPGSVKADSVKAGTAPVAEPERPADDDTRTTQLKPMVAAESKPTAATAASTSSTASSAPAGSGATKTATVKTVTAKSPGGDKGGKGKAALTAVGSGVARIRNLIASLVWLAAVLCAAVLALGALFTALDQANQSNEIVRWVLERGHDLVGPFADVFRLETAKNTLLVNWGIAALVYLIAGKILERVIRP
ncbi:hypothetical protein [Kribbella deserti]|uniref:Transmembrane protein n=1 Tax=Kribbella deserti TaxID=1926257 RepID=A0ABV6QVN4_9ACTN